MSHEAPRFMQSCQKAYHHSKVGIDEKIAQATTTILNKYDNLGTAREAIVESAGPSLSA